MTDALERDDTETDLMADDSEPELDLAEVEFADNPEPRCALVLLLDTSGSMAGQPIAQLNAGLRTFARTLREDRLAALRVEVAIVTFGGEVALLDVRGAGQAPADAEDAFVTVDGLQVPTLSAGGSTPMGAAARRGLALLEARKAVYKRGGLDYFRPWMLLMTDGRPTDRDWPAAAEAVRDAEARKGVAVYAVGVEGADMDKLARFTGARPPLKLKGLAFEELFQWLSSSLSAVSASRPGEQVPLPPVGWAEVDTGH